MMYPKAHMATQTLKLAGKEYVVVPKREFAELTRKANAHKSTSSHRMTPQDTGDVAKVKLLASKNEKTISLSQLRRELGL